MFLVGLLPVPIVVIANLAVGRPWAHYLIPILAGVLAGITFLYGALDLAGQLWNPAGAIHSSYAVDIGFMGTALVAAVLMSKPIRQRVSRIAPIDPDNPVHALALVLTVLLLGVLFTTTAFMSTLTADQSPLTVGDMLAQELPLLVIGGVGVGIFIRRDIPAAATRLGLVRPAWWHVVLALAAAGVFFTVGAAMDALAHSWTPGLARQVDVTTERLFSGLQNPVGIAVIALAPGICEEILFRGALQPRIGLIAAALLFAAFHTQYALSLDELSVFVIAMGLGLIRKFTNTTTSMICHVAYNLLVGVGVAVVSQLDVAVAIEAVLIGIAAYAIWSHRRRAAVPANP